MGGEQAKTAARKLEGRHEELLHSRAQVDGAGVLLGCGGDPGCRAGSAAGRGSEETGLLLGQQVGRAKHPASTYPQGSWGRRTLGSSEVLSPTLSVWQKSEALGEFIPEFGVGPLGHWTARNKQTSFCSQPWPPPCGIQDVCVSSSLLCLNTVCGMTCEGGQLRRWELGSLGSIPFAQAFRTYCH